MGSTIGYGDIRVLPGGMVQAPNGQFYTNMRAYKEHLKEVEAFTAELAALKIQPTEAPKPVPHNFGTATIQNGLTANMPAFYETVQQKPPVVEQQQEMPLPDYRNLGQHKQQPEFMKDLHQKVFPQSDPSRSVGEKAQDFASQTWDRVEDTAGLNDSWAYSYVFKPIWNNTSAPVKGLIVGAVALSVIGIYRSLKGNTVSVVVHNNHDYKALAEAMAKLQARNPTVVHPEKKAELKAAPAAAAAA